MIKDAEMNAEEDKKARELVDAKNSADALVHSTKKSLEEYGDKVGADEKANIETALKALEEVIPTGSKEDIEAKTEELAKVSQKLGEAIYADMQAKAQAEQAGGAAADDGKPQPADVVDADFKEVKKD